ncbi:MAG: hypothetical protein J6J13_05975 [Clostridia bacterium]|nr:hypothetical protein [Clostridia bacterium]
MNGSDIIWIIIIALFLFLIFVGALISWIVDLSRELKYINMEIKRCDGKEKKMWIKRKRRLFLAFIPFFRG